MRILRITVKNLASLSGEHTVDFTAEPLRSAGLFAIIGPTGSGKSTLLDAMCLALYDKTPRLKQAPSGGEQVDGVSQQDSRSLLRRGAWEGSAEVAFISTDGQTLTARWSVHRAGRGKKVAGRLQPVEMVLFRGDVRGDAEAEQECGGKKTQVLEAIEERIGLKFEQFTRAVLLAQNEFATFLRSKDDERMEILEALTGTHQFRAISQRVYQRASEEKNRIEELQNRLKGQLSLSEAERAAEESRLRDAAAEQKLASDELNKLQALKRWHTDFSERVTRLQDAKLRHTHAVADNSAAEPRRGQLLRIERAQRDARVLDQDLRLKQGSREKLDQDAAVTGEKVRKARLALDAANAAEEIAQREQHTLQLTLTSDQAKLESALVIQPQVELAKTSVEAADKRLKSARDTRGERARRLDECQNEIKRKLQRQDEIRTLLLPLEHLQPFAAESSLWIDRLTKLASSVRDEQEAQKEFEQCSLAATETQRELGEYQAASRRQKMDLNLHDQQLRELESQVLELNGGELRRTAQQLSENQLHLRLLQSQLKEQDRLAKELTNLNDDLRDEQEKQKDEAGEIAGLEPQARTAEIEQLAAERVVTRLTNAFDDHAKRLRAALEPGEECPVCGATEHPFAVSAADLEVNLLAEAKAAAQESRNEHEKLKGRLDRLKMAVAQRSPRIERLKRDIARKEQEIASFQFDNTDSRIVEEILALPPEQRQQRAKNAIEETQRQQATLQPQINECDRLEIKLGEHRTENTSRRELFEARTPEEARLSRCASDAASKKETNEALLRRREQDRIAAEQLLAPFWAALPQERAEFDADPAYFCRRLNDRLIALSELRSEENQTQAKLVMLQEQEPQLLTDQLTANTDFQNREFEHQRETEKLNRLERQLHELLGDQSIDQFRRAIEEQKESARKKLDNAVNGQIEARNALTAESARHDALQKQLVEAGEAERFAREKLNTWLAEFSPQLSPDEAYVQLQQMFGHDSGWIESEREALRELDRAVQKTEGEIQSCNQRLEEHLQQRTDERDEAAVQEALTAQQEIVAAADRTLQNVQRILQNDDETRSRNADLETEIREAEAKARPWLDLDQLIGSADGKKFTLMAQRFTLDLLLQHANVQLRELAGRYRLERLGESLNLGVIDQDLGSELRSVHSLSGGETFLVSLALALGLASLTSSRLRIESLFIDEGFGSLDEDTLEVAMNALNHLQSQGRKVGVITHVERMQDAISTQIHVRRGPGGASRIVLPRSDTQAD